MEDSKKKLPAIHIVFNLRNTEKLHLQNTIWEPTVITEKVVFVSNQGVRCKYTCLAGLVLSKNYW